MCRSVPQTEATFTLTRTSVSPNVGIFTSRISAPALASGFTTASMVSGIGGTHCRKPSARKLLILAPCLLLHPLDLPQMIGVVDGKTLNNLRNREHAFEFGMKAAFIQIAF